MLEAYGAPFLMPRVRWSSTPPPRAVARGPAVAVAGKEETRVDGNQVAWCLLTSSNLSTSALGFLDKKVMVMVVLLRR